MTEEYRIIEEGQENNTLMAEALKVGKNITALVNCQRLMWGATIEECQKFLTHICLSTR